MLCIDSHRHLADSSDHSLSRCNLRVRDALLPGRVAKPSFVISHEGARVMAGEDRENLLKLTSSHEINRAATLQERYRSVKPPQAIFPLRENFIE
jgi:hypothetical protein